MGNDSHYKGDYKENYTQLLKIPVLLPKLPKQCLRDTRKKWKNMLS